MVKNFLKETMGPDTLVINIDYVTRHGKKKSQPYILVKFTSFVIKFKRAEKKKISGFRDQSGKRFLSGSTEFKEQMNTVLKEFQQ